MKLKKFIGSKIKSFRDARNMNQDDLAVLLGTTKQTVSRYENGDRQANQDVLFKLAGIFKVSIDDFFPPINIEEEKLPKFRNYTYYPIAISAGSPMEADAITENDVETISVPNIIMGRWAGTDGIYLTRANGDSMNRVIPHDSLIAVKEIELSELCDGDIVVYSDGVEFAVKRFYNDTQNGRLLFRPDSTDRSFVDNIVSYEDADRVKIHGKVVLHITELN